MNFLIIVSEHGLSAIYSGEGKSERDQEAKFLELKLATDNPSVKEDLEYWKRLIQERNYYGLLILVDHDKNQVEYLPFETKQDYDSMVKDFKEIKRLSGSARRKLKRMTRKSLFGKLGRREREVEPEMKGRRQGQLALDIRGLDRKSQKNILDALKKEKADVFLVKEDKDVESERRGSK